MSKDVTPVLEIADLQERAANIIKGLWDRGIIVSHPTEMLHADGLHKLDLAPSIRGAQLGPAMEDLMPQMLVLLQGLLPQDAVVNS